MTKSLGGGIVRSLAVLGLVVAWLGQPAEARAQGTKEDYARAERLRADSQGKVFKARVDPHWFADNDAFWYRNDLAQGAREFVVVDAVKRVRRPAFDHAKVAAALGRATEKSIPPDHLPMDWIQVEPDGSIRFENSGKGWRYDPAGDTLKEAEVPKKPAESTEPTGPPRGGGSRRRQGSPRSDSSPDGKWQTFVKDHNLFLRRKESGEEFALSDEGTAADSYEPRAFWSPDSKKLVAIRTAKGDERKVYLIESSPRSQLQPKLHSYDYLKPGDKVAVSKPHLFDVEARKSVPVSDALFENPYSNEEYRWAADSKRFTFLFNQRGHQLLRLVAVDAETGEAKSLIEEKFPTFVDYSNKTYVQFFEKTDEILWMSERDGWNHLYLFDAPSGQVKYQITKGTWLVRGVDRVDEENRQIWFRAGGIHPGQDPYYIHYARVNFDGTGLTQFTVGDGTHQIRYSPDRRYILDTYSRIDKSPVTELRREDDGGLVAEVERADWSVLRESAWQVPERFVAKGRDGTSDIYGVIFRPSIFDSTKKYPVIEQIYAGPQGAFVPKAFSAYSRPQSLAELGFIVVQIDGMGTNWRSKAFHDVCAKNLGDAGFPDRILWMKAAAEKYPYMDLSRVGVYGGSAGGQNALRAVLAYGDFYKAAAADCGCHDNRMDKIWWNEAWMGWPIGPHYEDQSNVTQAHKLQGKLLLTVGELDHNVDPASTMQVVNALIKADKDFELIVFPGADHGAGGGKYGDRRRSDFFVRHLLGVEPRSH
jgi:dipeptidyl-peptidase 4